MSKLPNSRIKPTTRKSSLLVAALLVGFGLFGFFGTCYWVSTHSKAIDHTKPLPPSAQFRGAYVRFGTYPNPLCRQLK
jgi:hypothetical protein